MEIFIIIIAIGLVIAYIPLFTTPLLSKRIGLEKTKTFSYVLLIIATVIVFGSSATLVIQYNLGNI